MSLRACAARPAHRAALSVSSIWSTIEVSISFRLKVADACGKSSSTVYRVLKKVKIPREKQRNSPLPIKEDQEKRKRFHVTEEERPTLKGILRAMKERIQYQGSVSSLRKIILDLGFKWKRAENNRKLLVEKSDIRNMRLNYLRNIQELREAGHNIVYMDETYFHSSSALPAAPAVPLLLPTPPHPSPQNPHPSMREPFHHITANTISQVSHYMCQGRCDMNSVSAVLIHHKTSQLTAE
ncbi:hypothetical protein J6590_077614 [Homalodisca vitripennis]|nr:hypothetical protein J6590_077614 [Homalodisca vitripennis]